MNRSRLKVFISLTALALASAPRLEAADPPSGFTALFNGKDLTGWYGLPHTDPKELAAMTPEQRAAKREKDSAAFTQHWRVENGVLIGEITPTTVVKSNTFVIWRGGRPSDFELKLDYRITLDGNSGINYRSTIVPDPVTPENRFAMRGYQCDVDGRQRYTGNNYEEKGREFLALRGQVTRQPEEPPHQRLILGRQLIDRIDVLVGHDHDVHRSRRADVAEGRGIFILIYEGRGGFLLNDPAK